MSESGLRISERSKDIEDELSDLLLLERRRESGRSRNAKQKEYWRKRLLRTRFRYARLCDRSTLPPFLSWDWAGPRHHLYLLSQGRPRQRRRRKLRGKISPSKRLAQTKQTKRQSEVQVQASRSPLSFGSVATLYRNQSSSWPKSQPEAAGGRGSIRRIRRIRKIKRNISSDLLCPFACPPETCNWLLELVASRMSSDKVFYELKRCALPLRCQRGECGFLCSETQALQKLQMCPECRARSNFFLSPYFDFDFAQSTRVFPIRGGKGKAKIRGIDEVTRVVVLTNLSGTFKNPAPLKDFLKKLKTPGALASLKFVIAKLQEDTPLLRELLSVLKQRDLTFLKWISHFENVQRFVPSRLAFRTHSFAC